MVFTLVLEKMADWVSRLAWANSFCRATRKVGSHGPLLRASSSLRPQQQPGAYPSVAKCPLEGMASQTLVCDIHQTLLRTHSFFPYFMLVAFEGGGIVRAFLLLLVWLLMWAVRNDRLRLRAMIFVAFCGLRRRDVECVQRAVLPKFYLENLNLLAYEVVESAGRVVVITSVPKVMVEGFLREYLGVGEVVGTELHLVGDRFTGLVAGSGVVVKHKAAREVFGENQQPDIGLGGGSLHDHHLLSLCKEAYVVGREDDLKNDSTSAVIMPRSRYPKPLIFHDGRLAFLPTPVATLAMFLYLPIGIPLAVFRLAAGTLLPYKLSILLGCGSGVGLMVKGQRPPKLTGRSNELGGVLYVCTHRTLLDPIMLSLALERPVTAVTYSVSRVSEAISPLKTVRLTRDRHRDGAMMRRLLGEGDLVVCPEGTTCREPYLLRFSSLFAELAEEMVPVAMDARVSMFYGTTATGLKCLDPIFFLMNPRPVYRVEFLGRVPREETCAGGMAGVEVANRIQRRLAEALGFQCTGLTRRDKYMMLAGNEGLVPQDQECGRSKTSPIGRTA